jgi:hypothetical protein
MLAPAPEGGEESVLSTDCLSPGEVLPLHTGWENAGPQSGSECFGKEKNLCPCWESTPIIYLAARLYLLPTVFIIITARTLTV